MILKTIRVSDKGQVAIPLEIREATGIKKGDNLVIVQEGDKIMLQPAKKAFEKLEDDFSDLMKLSEGSLRGLWDNEADEIWNKYLEE